jgi:hypothetical protein
MAAALGSLVVSLGLDAAEFTSGLTKAEFQARRFGEALGRGIRDAASLAAASLATIGTGAVTAFVGLDSLIKKAGDFQDLAEKTGASAEALASFGVAAGTAGTSVEAIAQASIKLTKNLTGVDDESKAAGSALAALGLNIADFKKLAPEQQIEIISKSLAGFADGAGKTAVATALLGKSGAELLPFLKALEEQGGRQVILTAEQIKQADDYADKQAKLKAEIGLYAQALSTQAIPAMTAFMGAIADTLKEIVGLDGGVVKLAANNGVADFAEGAVRALGFILDAADGVVRAFQAIGTGIAAQAAVVNAALHLDVKGAASIAVDGVKQVQAILDRPLFSTKLSERLAAQKRDAALARQENRGFTPNQPQLKFNGATTKSGGGDDPTKKILDNQLKAYESAAKEEEDILRSRNRMLDLYNGENLISTKAYFEGKRAAQTAAVSSQIALYDQEIAALQKYQASAGKATDREAAQGKINDLIEKKKRLTREAGETAIEWGFKERRALEDLARQMNSVNAEVLELTGNLGEAARIRVGDQFADITKRLQANGDTDGLAQVGRLKQLKIAQADYGQQAEQVGRITESLRIQEEHIGLARQLGADSELSSLVKLRDARTAAVTQMQSIVAAQEAIAKASGNPALVQNAERARLELDKLAATADPLADKFNSVFSESFGSAFADFVTGSKTAKEAFTSFANSVIGQLAKMAAESVAKDLFGSLFGGGTGGSGGSIGSFLSGLFGKASGGSVGPGDMVRVNEQGPELLDYQGKQYLMNGNRNARITPNSGLSGGGGGLTVYYQAQPGETRKTAAQNGRAFAEQASRFQRRDS